MGRKDHPKKDTSKTFDITPANDEQEAAVNILLDNEVKLKIITGKEGTGKNYITIAAIMELFFDKSNKYKKIVLTRTTDEVGESLGYLPGNLDEKFGPHLQSFKYTFSSIMKDTSYIDMMLEKKIIEYMPLQFMRGISFPPGTIVWADEIAGLSPFELRMLCTRLGEGCILILTGSLEQIDRKVAPEQTGLYKLIHSYKIHTSPLVEHVELVQNQRSRLSNLISEVL